MLPSGLDFQGPTPSQGAYDPATGLWTVGSLASGASATLVLSALVSSPDLRTNTATVDTSDQYDPDPGSDSDSVTVTTQAADLAVSKSATTDTPIGRGSVLFTVTVTNAGPDQASDVVLTDLLPAPLLYVEDVASRGVYDAATGRWTIGLMGPGESVSLQILARSATVVNVASATSGQYDPDPSNNSASVTVVTPASTIPRVVSNARYGFHHQPTTLVLGFNTSLDPTRAQDVRNYTLARLGPRGRELGRFAIASAHYDPARTTVTLHPARRLRLFATCRVTVDGTSPGGVADASGVLLGADRVGVPGGTRS